MRSFLLILYTLVIAITSSSGQLFAANQAKPLSVAFTYGHNGILRADSRFLPSDVIYATAIARGHQIPASGICQFSLRYSLLDNDGKAIFTHADDNIVVQIELGATDVKLMPRCELAPMLKAGEYNFVMQLRDKKTRETYQSSQPITILSQDDFTLTDFRFTANSESTVPIGTTFETCQLVFLYWNSYNPKLKEEPRLTEVGFRVLDGNQQSIDPPIESRQKELPKTSNGIIRLYINLQVINPGDYTVEVTTKDVLSGKTETRSIPFRVVPSLSDILPAPAQ